MGNLTFKKHERLKKEKSIQELFEKGSTLNIYPFRVYFLPNIVQPAHQVLFSAPARSFKKAVDRNKIKRRSREAYRLQKSQLNIPTSLFIAFVYTAKEMTEYSTISEAIKKAILKLNSRDWEKG